VVHVCVLLDDRVTAKRVPKCEKSRKSAIFCNEVLRGLWEFLPRLGKMCQSFAMASLGNRDAQFIGQSGAFLDAMERASRAAPLRRPVLVIGERGTGKELIAERLHRLSRAGTSR
jgi:transcriptional regulator with PAS, ATPase and Fis domain